MRRTALARNSYDGGRGELYSGATACHGASMNEITSVLEALKQGRSGAADDLLALVYGDLRQMAAAKMAREQPGHTLQATALVHEAWLRLGNGAFANRAHFFGAASEAMRRILIEGIRRKRRRKRGGEAEHIDVAEAEIAAPEGNEAEALAVHEALDRLAAIDTRKGEVVKLRYFVGFSFEETAELPGHFGSNSEKRMGLRASLVAPANCVGLTD